MSAVDESWIDITTTAEDGDNKRYLNPANGDVFVLLPSGELKQVAEPEGKLEVKEREDGTFDVVNPVTGKAINDNPLTIDEAETLTHDMDTPKDME